MSLNKAFTEQLLHSQGLEVSGFLTTAPWVKMYRKSTPTYGPWHCAVKKLYLSRSATDNLQASWWRHDSLYSYEKLHQLPCTSNV